MESDIKTNATTLGGTPTLVKDSTTKPSATDDDKPFVFGIDLRNSRKQYLQLQGALAGRRYRRTQRHCSAAKQSQNAVAELGEELRGLTANVTGMDALTLLLGSETVSDTNAINLSPNSAPQHVLAGLARA